MDRIPKPGEFYRHFKDRLYQVLAVAVHSETDEDMVVYQALYGDFRIYVRPLASFVEAVDRQKYPKVLQWFRFELVMPGKKAAQSTGADGWADVGSDDEEDSAAKEEPVANSLLLAFLDAETWEEKRRIILSMKGKVGQSEVGSLYLVLDMKPHSGSVEEQLDNLIKHLEMQQHFDASRLRRG